MTVFAIYLARPNKSQKTAFSPDLFWFFQFWTFINVQNRFSAQTADEIVVKK
jgi:hypothetical protein